MGRMTPAVAWLNAHLRECPELTMREIERLRLTPHKPLLKRMGVCVRFALAELWERAHRV